MYFTELLPCAHKTVVSTDWEPCDAVNGKNNNWNEIQRKYLHFKK